MIRRLGRVIDPADRGLYRRFLALLLAYNLLQGVAYVLMVPVIEALLSGDTGLAARWCAPLGGAIAVGWAAHLAQQRAGFDLGLALSRTLHHRIGDHLARLPMGWFTGDRVGQVGHLTSSGVNDVMGLPAHLLQPIAAALITPATVLVGLAVIEWRLALVLAAGIPVLWAVFAVAGRFAARADRRVQATAAEAAGRVVEYARRQPQLRAFGRVGDDFDSLSRALDGQQRAGARQLWHVLVGLGGAGAAVQGLATVLLATGVAMAIDGVVEPVTLMAVAVLITRFIEPLSTVAVEGSMLRTAAGSLDRIEALIHTPPLPEPAVGREPQGNRLELDGVGFAYAESPVLVNCSLTVDPGEMVALAGASGAGKSTVVRLIARFFDVDSGAVRIGGVDVREMTTTQLWSRVAVVFQDVQLMEGTIRDNVLMGRPDADEGALHRVAAAARVDEIVARLPGGWDTPVGEGGAALSGGERQRVSIARALLKDAPIVVFDEATAALDGENELAIAAALDRLRADRVLLVIAHRPATAVAADRIVVLDGGTIVEQGTHDQLVAAGGNYAAQWQRRRAARGWCVVG